MHTKLTNKKQTRSIHTIHETRALHRSQMTTIAALLLHMLGMIITEAQI